MKMHEWKTGEAEVQIVTLSKDCFLQSSKGMLRSSCVFRIRADGLFLVDSSSGFQGTP